MSYKGPIPPHDPEAEAALLGSIMLLPLETLDLCRQFGLNPQYAKPKDPPRVPQFYVPAHETIYLALLAMSERGDPIDLVTVTAELRKNNTLETVGGPPAVTALCTMVPTAANAEYYIDIIRRKYLRRTMIRLGTEVVRRSYGDPIDENDILDQAQAEITGLSEENFADNPVRPIADDVDETMRYAEAIYKARGRDAIHGLATGFYDLDRMTGGFTGGQLIVFAGRPAMGKTILGLNIASYVATKEWKPSPVLFFSLEMTRPQIMRRLFIQSAGQDAKFTEKLMRTGLFSEREIREIIPETGGRLRNAPIYLDATPGLRIPDFKARARRLRSQKKIGLIVIDYIQLMKSPTRRAQENRVLELTEISGALKEMAKELDIPIIALAQLNRETEKRSKGEPRLMDLRESGSIENDADLVGLLYRAFYYTKEPEDEGLAEIRIAKHRDGPPGVVKLAFLDKLMRFENLTAQQLSNDPSKRQEIDDE